MSEMIRLGIRYYRWSLKKNENEEWRMLHCEEHSDLYCAPEDNEIYEIEGDK
jgi:hypothetical protein